MSKFYCDDKYVVVISALEGRGWTRVSSLQSSTNSLHKEKKERVFLPSDCSLVWTNLQSVAFNGIFQRTVNHFKGAQHLSNKAFLATHLVASKLQHLSPPTWTPVSNSIVDLVILLISNTLYVSLKKLSASGFTESLQNIIFQVDQALALLPESYLPPFLLHWQASSRLHGLMNCPMEESRSIALQIVAEMEAIEPWRAAYGGDEDIWIVKPVGSSCGREILVVRGAEGVLEAAQCMQSFKCIVQK